MRSPRNIAIVVTIALAIALLLYALQPSLPQLEEEKAEAALTFLNYSDVDVYVRVAPVTDPTNGASSGGGPGSRGGLDCCIEVPVKWRPHIKMIVEYQFGDEPKEKWYTQIVELPPYPDGEAGNIWLAFYADRSFELISSNYGPASPTGKWPGRIKKFPGEIHDNQTS